MIFKSKMRLYRHLFIGYLLFLFVACILYILTGLLEVVIFIMICFLVFATMDYLLAIIEEVGNES